MASGLETLKKVVTTALLSWTAFFIYVGWLVLFSQTDIAARLNGNLFPVMTTLQIENMEQIEYRGLPATRIKGNAVKLRQCSPIQMSWYLHGEDGIRVPVEGFFEDAPETRTSGLQQWSGIVVGIDVERLNRVSSTVRHECGSFPVITEFYKGGGVQ